MVNNIGALGAVNPLQAAAYYQVCSLLLILALSLSLSFSLSHVIHFFQLLHASAGATANNSFGLGTQLGNSKFIQEQRLHL